MFDVVTPFPSNNNIGVQPYIDFSLGDSSQLGFMHVYLGFYYQKFLITGKFEYENTDYDETAEGELKFALGYYTPLVGSKIFLKKGSTRPYLNMHYRLYIQNINVDGELETETEDFSWEGSKDIGNAFKDIIVISNKEFGLGVEHKINKNLAIFGEYNFHFFAFKVKVSNGEDYMEDISDAIENLEDGGIDTQINIEELKYIEGKAKAKIKYSSNYASLGIAFYF